MTSWKQVHTLIENIHLRRQVWRGVPWSPRGRVDALDTQGKVLLVQGADSPEGGLRTGLAHERSRSCCPLARLTAGARGTPASASLHGPAGPWLVESARLDGE